MKDNRLPQAIENALTQPTPEAVFTNLLPALGEALQVDRCFLHLRDPQTRFYRNICWRRDRSLPDTSTDGWERESEWERDDPLFAAALRGEQSIFVADIESASPTVLNVEFERQYLKHRALVHAHLYQEGLLWGILQPSIANRPKEWHDFDRWLVEQIAQTLTPIAIRYIREKKD